MDNDKEATGPSKEDREYKDDEIEYAGDDDTDIEPDEDAVSEPDEESEEFVYDPNLLCDICGAGPFKSPGGLRLHKVNKHRVGTKKGKLEQPGGRDAEQPILKGPEATEQRRRERLLSTLEIAPHMSVDKMTWVMRIWDNTPHIRKSARELYSLLMSLDRMNHNTAKWIVDMVFIPEEGQADHSYYPPDERVHEGGGYYPPDSKVAEGYYEEHPQYSSSRQNSVSVSGPQEPMYTESEVREMVQREIENFKKDLEIQELKKRIEEIESGGGKQNVQMIKRQRPILDANGNPVYDSKGRPMFEIIEMPVEEYKLEIMRQDKVDVSEIIEKVAKELRPPEKDDTEIRALRQKLEEMERRALEQKYENSLKIVEERTVAEIRNLKAQLDAASRVNELQVRGIQDMSDEAKVAMKELTTTAEMSKEVLSNINRTVLTGMNLLMRGSQPVGLPPSTTPITPEEQERIRREFGPDYVIE